MRLESLFARAAARFADRIAVVGTNDSITYGELDRLANRFAHTLRACGVGPGDRVGLHLTRGSSAIAAMIGVLRLGAAYVPLDPGSPSSRIALIAKDCGLRHVVVASHLREGWFESGAAEGATHMLTAEEGVQEAPVTALSPITSTPDELAYILYTSGSTGVPKGVMLSHGNALAFVDWASDLVDLSPEDRVASVAPFHFDLSVFDIWASLSRGATIVIVDEGTVTSGARMVARIREQQIRVWYSVPTAISLMLDAGDLEDGGAPSLRAVFFAGEVMPMKQLRRAMRALPSARFYNLFGPTETNVCTAYEVPGVPPEDVGAIPIGRPSCGDTALVLDPEGRPVADGEVGELFIEGPTVMLGYWDGGRRTPARHPYPTGDMVSRRADGELMYHGRRDHMVKVRGFRVELGEVEAALAAHDLVKEAIVVLHEQELVAVIIPADPALSVLEVKQHCAARLPKYMVPHGVRFVQTLPRTSNGKTDRIRTAAAIREGGGDARW